VIEVAQRLAGQLQPRHRQRFDGAMNVNPDTPKRRRTCGTLLAQWNNSDGVAHDEYEPW
jgi:hypothetical protein